MTNQTRSRTPKVKEFVRAPFVACPDCGENAFGVLMICRGHYVRRCIHCWYDKRFPLPNIQKRLIYLDQFVISNMMKELDPARPVAKKGSLGGFYRTLFETLDRLCKFQLITCPDSPVQDHESVVYPHYEKVRKVFRQLSHGLTFLEPETIFHAQILNAFGSWLTGKPTADPLDRQFALHGDPNGWQERFRIELNYTAPGLVHELKTVNASRTKHLHALCNEWKNDPNFHFAEVFDRELAGHAKRLMGEFSTYIQRYAETERQGAYPDAYLCFPPESVGLVSRMLADIGRVVPNPSERVAKVREFFASDHFRSLPFARISALFWASLARDVHAGRKAAAFPGAGMYNDIDVVSAYASFCDAMFVDKEIAHLAGQAELKKELVGKSQVFSLRQKERAAFIEYLRGIEANAQPEHLKLVREVYGDDWGSPFVQLLSR
jgi:hypothetical protein